MKKFLSGKYEIRGEIARGGMGILYKAFHPAQNRFVVIKTLYPHLAADEGVVRRFLREARAMARLDHPHIVHLYEVGEDEGIRYIVMEHIAGQDLRHKIKEGGPLPWREAVEIALQVGDALSYAHEQGIIHRDIKPGNILVCEDGQIKVGDFGIAAAVDEGTVTTSERCVGTPEYMAPEQARGESVDRRADLYSLGILIYKMITGLTPFEGMSRMAIVGRLVSREEELELHFPPSVPHALQKITEKLVRRTPASRYSAVRDLVQDLRRLKEEFPPDEETITATLPLSPPARVTLTRMSLFLISVCLCLFVWWIRGEEKLRLSREAEQLPTALLETRSRLTQEREESDEVDSGRNDSLLRTSEDRRPEDSVREQVAVAKSRVDRPSVKQEVRPEAPLQEKAPEILVVQGEPEAPPALPPQPSPPGQGLTENLLHSLAAHEEEREDGGGEFAKAEVLELAVREGQGKEEEQMMEEIVRRPPLRVPPSQADVETIAGLLQELKGAYEKKDLDALKRLSRLRPSTEKSVRRLFREYETISIGIDDIRITEGSATAVLTIMTLSDRFGNIVTPGDQWRRRIVTVNKVDGTWGTMIW